jgi:hypothetical protein
MPKIASKLNATKKKKSQRDWFTFAALVAAATAAIITLIVSHSDNRAIIRGAEDTEKRQLRAYVFVNEDEITELDNPTGPVTSIKITNSGRTPAYKLTHVLVYTNAIKYRHKESLPPVPTGEGSLSDLWPGGTHSKINQRRRITPLELAGLEAGDLVIYLYGEVRFTDAFSCQRWMRYKYLLGGPGAYRGLYLTIAEDGNETSDETAEDCLYEAPH